MENLLMRFIFMLSLSLFASSSAFSQTGIYANPESGGTLSIQHEKLSGGRYRIKYCRVNGKTLKISCDLLGRLEGYTLVELDKVIALIEKNQERTLGICSGAAFLAYAGTRTKAWQTQGRPRGTRIALALVAGVLTYGVADSQLRGINEKTAIRNVKEAIQKKDLTFDHDYQIIDMKRNLANAFASFESLKPDQK